MKNKRPPISELLKMGGADIRSVGDLDQWEDRLVNWLFVRHRVPSSLRKEILSTAENGRVSLNAWNNCFFTYPVWFGATILRKADKITSVAHLAVRMQSSRLLDEFVSFEGECEVDSKPLALIVRWPHLVKLGESSGAMVLHTRSPNFTVKGTRIIWVHEFEGKTQMLTLSPLSLLVAEIDEDSGGVWSPCDFGED